MITGTYVRVEKLLNQAKAVQSDCQLAITEDDISCHIIPTVLLLFILGMMLDDTVADVSDNVHVVKEGVVG